MAKTNTVKIPADNEAGYVIVDADETGEPIGDVSKWAPKKAKNMLGEAEEAEEETDDAPKKGRPKKADKE